MLKTKPLLRLARVSTDRKRLLIRATILLALTSAAVALLPFRHAIRLGSVALGGRKPIDPDDVLWAVEAVARQLPLRTVCIEKGLVVQRLLRSGGLDARLHYGARHTPSREIEAHVWVTVADRPVIGGEQANEFASVAAYP